MGVIAMPKDTPGNRERAIALMHSHFPEGYEVIADGEETLVSPPAAAPKDATNVHRKQLTDSVTAISWNDPGPMPYKLAGTAAVDE